MLGLDKFIDIIINQINDIIPWRFVYQYHSAAKYRFGKYVKSLGPGAHWKWCWMEKIYTENITDTTILLPTQTLPCKDFELVIRGLIGYKIVDVGKWFNNVNDTKSAISDNTCRIIRETLADLTYQEVKESKISFPDEIAELNDVLQELLQQQIEKYGILVNFVTLVEVSKARSYKLWNENIQLE